MFKLAFTLCLVLLTIFAHAEEARPASEDPALEARMLSITSELRCLVCQNQTIADSHAGLAIDLREQVRSMLKNGQSNAQILDYMTARYGDFILYRPPLKNSTFVLWIGPLVLLLAGFGVLIFVLRRRSRMPAENFDPEETNFTEDSHSSTRSS
jgi:cytochrome c-type biogenesis protein CcmH